MQKPTLPCYVCGGIAWWQQPDGSWRCGICHPNPNPKEGKPDEPEMVVVSDQPYPQLSQLNHLAQD